MTDQRREEPVGDAAVDAAWRSAARDEPPAHVDDAILAAARAAVRGNLQPRRPVARQPWWIAWQPLAAAAGVIGLSFLLVQMLPRDEVPAPVSTPATEVSASAAPAPESVPVKPEPARPPVAMSAEESVADRKSTADDSAAGARMESPALAGAAPPAAAQAAAERPAAPAPSPEAWASRIAALHDAGDMAAAAAELRAFRASHSDADRYLPGPLRAWAASVTHDGTP